MAEIVNLRMARKAKERADKDRKAQANRAKHGQTKGERQARKMESERSARELDSKKRESDA
ncbi:hypothetical protein MB02_12735 [Croceicoccus estronivorus]|uniref:DUF4169 family protein n=1 Tax=Croceicoccus estronivorus TaxID=1172626 RepID=UPI00082E1C2B|nr:DUF4169 family protein [Croceicoccus estronivorus]OCC23041.1 hypothetical protein MB02_12735 [Croceicoccus estronivorus]